MKLFIPVESWIETFGANCKFGQVVSIIAVSVVICWGPPGFSVANAADIDATSGLVRPDVREAGESSAGGGIHTPLAGEAYKTTLFGRTIEIPARDRENVRSLTLGGNYYTPELGGDVAVPIAVLYYRHRWDTWWTRDIIGLFVFLK